MLLGILALVVPAWAATCGPFYPTQVRAIESRIVGDQIQGLQDVNAPAFRQPDPTQTAPPILTLDTSKPLQRMTGFGGAMTESCALNLLKLPQDLRREALLRLFDKRQGAGFDSIRVPIGASDFADGSKGSYTYDDSPNNLPDPGFMHFDMSRDEKSFALIREARRINPYLRVLISPWSPPAWMKLPTALNGGALNPKYYADLARYFVLVVNGMRARGVPVDALTIQNEPGYPNDMYPSMGMDDQEQISFLRDYLIPELAASGVKVGFYVLDHNWDMYTDVDTILDDPIIAKNVAGIAYHCYDGDYTMMTQSNLAHPEVPTFQTECTGMLGEDPSDTFSWFMESYELGPTTLGSIGSMAWNLCLDQTGGPTNNGCYGCGGIITTDFSTSPPQLVNSPEYYALAQLSRAVVPGSRRLDVNMPTELNLMANAFQGPGGSYSLVVWNPNSTPTSLRLQRSECAAADLTIDPQSAVTLTWNEDWLGL